MRPEIRSLSRDGAPAITDAAALVVVGALRDLRVQLEVLNALLTEQLKSQRVLGEQVQRLEARVICLDESVDRAANAWFEVTRRVLPEKEQGNNGP